MSKIPLCECGCGEEVKQSKNKKYNKYINRHNNKGKKENFKKRFWDKVNIYQEKMVD